MKWIMEPLNGFKTISFIEAAEPCPKTWLQCSCTPGLISCHVNCTTQGALQ